MCHRAGESAWVSLPPFTSGVRFCCHHVSVSPTILCVVSLTLCPRSFKKNCLICRYRFSAYVGGVCSFCVVIGHPLQGFFSGSVHFIFNGGILVSPFVKFESFDTHVFPSFFLNKIKTIWYNAFCLFGGIKGRLYLPKQHNQIF